MEKTNVQILLTQEEYNTLKAEADKYSLTVAQYVKSKVLGEDEFSSAYGKLIEKVEALPVGTKFNIRALFGVEWTMSRGVKLRLGKTYNTQVKKGIIKNAAELDKDSSNVMWYERVAVMTKEEQIMDFLHKKVFDPILNCKTASKSVKSGTRTTIMRMEKLSAEKMVQYFCSALVQDNALAFSEKLEAEGLPRFEDVKDDFFALFDDAWLNS